MQSHCELPMSSLYKGMVEIHASYFAFNTTLSLFALAILIHE